MADGYDPLKSSLLRNSLSLWERVRVRAGEGKAVCGRGWSAAKPRRVKSTTEKGVAQLSGRTDIGPGGPAVPAGRLGRVSDKIPRQPRCARLGPPRLLTPK